MATIDATSPQRLSERVARLETAQETERPHLATKQDIEKLKADLTWRIVIAMSILTAIFVAITQSP